MNPLNVTPPPTHTLHGFICFLSAWIGRLPHVCVWRVQRLPAGGLGRCEGQWLFGGGYSFSATPAAQHIAAKVRLPPPPRSFTLIIFTNTARLYAATRHSLLTAEMMYGSKMRT